MVDGIGIELVTVEDRQTRDVDRIHEDRRMDLGMMEDLGMGIATVQDPQIRDVDRILADGQIHEDSRMAFGTAEDRQIPVDGLRMGL
jgi:hypothetical protein